jgi:hypothetical protein
VRSSLSEKRCKQRLDNVVVVLESSKHHPREIVMHCALTDVSLQLLARRVYVRTDVYFAKSTGQLAHVNDTTVLVSSLRECKVVNKTQCLNGP